ncbi:hypothetical protein [Lactovum odontotermitis]
MSKKEWLAYFEDVQGRKPTMAEFELAKNSGEFEDSNSKTMESLKIVSSSSAVTSDVKKPTVYTGAQGLSPTSSKKRNWLIPVISIIFVAIVGLVIGYSAISASKVSIIDDSSVVIGGLDGIGTATISQTVYQAERKALAEKTGFSEDEAALIASGNSGTLLTDYPDKTSKYNSLMAKVTISLDESAGLSDNDSVTLTIKASGLGMPIKSESEEYYADDLKSADDITNLAAVFDEAGYRFNVEGDHLSGAYFNFVYNPTSENYQVSIVSSIHDVETNEYYYRTANVTMSKELTFDVSTLSDYYDSVPFTTSKALYDAIDKYFPNAKYISNLN